MSRGINKITKVPVIHYRGHVIERVPDNGHIWIYPEENTSDGIVSHITCARSSTEVDLKRILDLKLSICEEAFDDYFLGDFEFVDED